MHSWFKTHSKKIMAVLGAGLMVTFLIQNPTMNAARSRGRGSPIAYMGKLPLYADEKASAAREWEMLEKTYRADIWESRHQFATPLQELGNGLAQEIHTHPDLFLILAKEAEQRGISISNDIVGTAVRNRIRPLPMVPFTANDPAFEEAVRRLLMIVALRDELNSNVKVSEPQWQHASTEMLRRMRLNMVEFSAPQIAAKAPAPTTQQVSEFFEKYRDVAPSAAHSTADTLNFGYQVPDRVKVQYVTVPYDQVLKAARATRATTGDKPGELPYDLKVEAYKYWLEHQSDFQRPAEAAPTTQPTAPATQASTQSATQSSTTAGQDRSVTQPALAAATEPAGPTTRPFAEVQDEIVANILKPDAEELSKKVADAIRDKMSADWQAFHQTHPDFHPAPVPTTHPAEAVGPATQPTGFDSYGYLDDVRAEIQRRFNVSIEISQPAGWKTVVDLSNLSGIGASSTGQEGFPAHAVGQAAPFITDPTARAAALQLLQPSKILKDATNNQYIFRLIDASPAHAPDLKEMVARVEEDAKIKAGYAQANAAAAKLLETARKDGFASAARNAGLAVLSTGMFNAESAADSRTIANFQHSEEAVQAVADKAVELAGQATEQNPHPLGLVQIPGERLVLVVELGDVSTPSSDLLTGFKVQRMAMEEARSVEPICDSYFTYDAVIKRVDYKLADKNK